MRVQTINVNKLHYYRNLDNLLYWMAGLLKEGMIEYI